MISILWTITYLFSLSLGSGLVKEFHCTASSDGLCIIDEISYNQDNTMTAIFPQNYTHFRVFSPSRVVSSLVKVFDRKLYHEMGQPLAIEFLFVRMERLVIPRKLVFADFSFNKIKELSLEEGEEEPLLTNLGLRWNDLQNVTSISALVNLQALDLRYNELTALDPKAFAKLIKLERLILNYNRIIRLFGEMLPPSLTRLEIVSNRLKSLDFHSFSQPSMQTLDISRNGLESLDAAALLLAMPKLQRIIINSNRLKLELTTAITKVLAQHNVSWRRDATVDEFHDFHGCYIYETVINGICHSKSAVPRSWTKCVGLSSLIVMVAALQILVVRWVLKVMADLDVELFKRCFT